MAKILAKNLFNKRVMLTDGSELGHAADVVMDMQGGALIYLVVKPTNNVDISKYKKQNNYVLIPFEGSKSRQGLCHS